MREKSAKIEVATDVGCWLLAVSCWMLVVAFAMMMFVALFHFNVTASILFCCRLVAQINVNDVKLLSQRA